MTTNPSTVLHMAPTDVWLAAKASGENYVDPSLESEGFIHCSTVEQILMPANAIYRGRTDLVLLIIDLARVPSETIFEDCYESGHAFPHIYGPIPVAAVTEVLPFPCEPDGSFQLPAQLR